MFAIETENLVEQLIQAEYKNACKNYGEKFNSLHEGYAVLLEEVEEAKEQIENIEVDICDVWRAIKNNASYIVEDNCKRLLNNIESCISELAQVGAVVRKIRTTKDEEEE